MSQKLAASEETFPKFIIYNAIIKPMWAYGLELWGAQVPGFKNNPEISQQISPTGADAPSYVFNQTLHNDFTVPLVLYKIIMEK